jgi:hypothetical protein
MTTIKETRRFPLENVVVKPDDIRELASITTQAAEKSATQESQQRMSFAIVADDGSEYDSVTADVFAKGGILDTKQIQSISIVFSDYAKDSRISIHIIHGNVYAPGNQISVAGTDSTWVNGVTRQFEESVSRYQPQASWPRRAEWPLRILTALGIGRVFIAAEDFVLSHIIHIQPITPRPTWANSIEPLVGPIQWLLGLVAGIAPSILLTDKLMELWPTVELRMGREWAQVSKRRRDRLWLVLSIGVIPLLLTGLYDLGKYLATR